MEQNQAWNNFRVKDEQVRRTTQQVSLEGVPGFNNLGANANAAVQDAAFNMGGAPGTGASPREHSSRTQDGASGRMAASFMQHAYSQFTTGGAPTYPTPPASDPMRKYRFTTNAEAHEADLRRDPNDAFASSHTGMQPHHGVPGGGARRPGDDEFGVSARQRVEKEFAMHKMEKRNNEEITEDLFDDSSSSYNRFFKRNLASTSVFLLVVSLLVYTSLDPVASDFILKLSLSSPLNDRQIKGHMVGAVTS